MLTSIQATMSSLESWYFGAQYLSLLPRCLRLAPNVTIRHSKLAFGGVAYSFPSRIHTYTLSYPCRAHYLTPSAFWKKKLSETLFFRCNRKYIINLCHIQKLDQHYVYLTNGQKLPVSRRRWTELQKRFIQYDLGAE